MNLKIVWVIGNNQYAPYVIHHLDDENIQVASSHRQLTNNDVQIISKCESLDLKPDAIVLLNFRFNYLNGTVNINEEFFKQHRCPFYIFEHTSMTLRIKEEYDVNFIELRNSKEGIEVYQRAIINLIMKVLIEQNEILINDLDIDIIDDNKISPLIAESLRKINCNVKVVSKDYDFNDRPNVIIVTDSIKLDWSMINKWSSHNNIIINLFEDNNSFSVIKNQKIQRIYSLRLPRYGLQSYAYTLAKIIKKDILGGI